MASESKTDGGAENPNILFKIHRSKNLNEVVYEARPNEDNSGFRLDEPVQVYWNTVDPAYQQKNRARGVMTDREELNMLEKRLAYGVSWKSSEDKQFELTLVALPEKKLKLVMVDGRPRALGELEGKPAYLTKIYVASKERWTGLPKVLYVDLTGVAVDGGDEIKHRINKA